MTVSPIRFGDEGQIATRELLRRFQALDGEPPETLARQVRALEALDRQYGGASPLPVEDAGELVDAVIAGLAQLGDESADLVVGACLWAIRHDVRVTAVEPVVNALALRSNRAAGKAELAAVFGLMQGFIAHVRTSLAADLERSNPERPWRILHVNFVITAIRTEDPALMDFAFESLDHALPDECRGFYAEALALAMSPRIPPEVRERIAARHALWTRDD